MNRATNGSTGAATNSAGVADLEQASVHDHADAVGESGRVLEVVGDDEHGEAEPAAGGAARAERPAQRVRVEGRQRLVEQQDARVAGEGAGESDALTLAAGDRARSRFREAGRSGTARAARRPRLDRARRTRRSAAHSGAGRARSPGTRGRPPALGGQVDATCRVEPRLAVEHDPAPLGPGGAPRSPAARSTCPRPTADEGERLRADLEGQLESEHRRGRKDLGGAP